MSDEQEVLLITPLQEGAEYCVKARVVLHTGVHSGFTDTCCVFVTGTEGAHAPAGALSS